MPRKTPKKVRAVDILLDILRDEGATTIFGNPGSTEMPLMDALVDAPDFRYVLGLQEATAVAMADGYALKTGRPAFVNLHAAGGLGNAMGVLVASKASETPLVRRTRCSASVIGPASDFSTTAPTTSRTNHTPTSGRGVIHLTESGPWRLPSRSRRDQRRIGSDGRSRPVVRRSPAPPRARPPGSARCRRSCPPGRRPDDAHRRR